MSRSLFYPAVSLIKSRLSDKKRGVDTETTHYQERKIKLWQKKKKIPKYGTVTLKGSPVLQNQDYGCRWQSR